MKEKGYAILVSNAAVVVAYKGIRILLDGLYKDLGNNFTELPDWEWKLMQQGKGDLANVDYLLFSHSHYDHYYSPYFFEYLKANEVKGFCMPPVDETPGLREALELTQDKQIQFNQNNDAQLEQGIVLKHFDVRHVDAQFYGITNQCFLLTIGDTRLAFLSDGDYHEEAFEKAKDLKVDIVFVTPIFYNNAKGRKIIRDVLEAKTIVIYHLPSIEDDRFMYYKMAERDAQKYAQEDETVLVWNKSGQYITFNE